MATEYTSKHALYLDADKSKVVAEDSPDAAYLLVSAGGTVTENELMLAGVADAEVRKRMLSKLTDRAAQQEADAQEQAASAKAGAKAAPEDKAIRRAPEDK